VSVAEGADKLEVKPNRARLTVGESADFAQNFFFDFFIMRRMGNREKLCDSRFSLCGNVRVAS